ncbi:unnamed protein product, partial [marine sediment metagenome]
MINFESLSKSYKKEDVLKLAGCVEQNSEHPIAVGIVKALKEQNIKLRKSSKFQIIKGMGVQGKYNAKEIKIVSAKYLEEQNVIIPTNVLENQAETVVFVLVSDELIGFIVLSDQIRPESYQAVQVLKDHGIRVLMITGDSETVAKSVSDKLGLDSYFARVLPHQKLEIIEKLQEEGEVVAMTGDGINDAPALAKADVGIAIGSGTDIAFETADIVLVRSNPMDVLSIISFGKATYQKMIQNLIWATGYNIFAIPLAAGVL